MLVPGKLLLSSSTQLVKFLTTTSFRHHVPGRYCCGLHRLINYIHTMLSYCHSMLSSVLHPRMLMFYIFMFLLIWNHKVLLITVHLCAKITEFLGMDTRPYTFSYAELKVGTDDFSPTNKLGEGGFGPVYKVSHVCS